jgi:hypothetical protein
MKVYVVVNGKDTKVYTDKAKAEVEKERVNKGYWMAGHNEGWAYIVETETE